MGFNRSPNPELSLHVQRRARRQLRAHSLREAATVPGVYENTPFPFRTLPSVCARV